MATAAIAAMSAAVMAMSVSVSVSAMMVTAVAGKHTAGGIGATVAAACLLAPLHEGQRHHRAGDRENY